MKPVLLFSVVLFACLTFASCAPSNESIQATIEAAIVQTQEVSVLETPVAIHTSIPEQTATNTLTSTPLQPLLDSESTPTVIAKVTEVSSTPTPTVTAKATEAASIPSTTAQLGDSWIRSIDGMEMLFVPAGTFLMGSDSNNNLATEAEMPEHQVTLGRFWVDRYEVTISQFQKFLMTTPVDERGDSEDEFEDYVKHQLSTRGFIDGWENYPVRVTWPEAQSYCEWAGGTLPTEAQWEYVARGPESRTFPWGEEDASCDLAVFTSCSSCYTRTETGSEICEPGHLSPVGRRPFGASWVGAEDLIGNAEEWVHDWYSEDYFGSSPSQNPPGPDAGTTKVVKGGHANSYPSYIYASARDNDDPQDQFAENGFRCVFVPDSEDNIVPTTVPSPTPSAGSQGQVAFLSDRDGEVQVYVMDSNGENPAVLTSLSKYSDMALNGISVPFSWSPDGSKIAIINEYRLYVLNSDGSGEIGIPNGSSDIVQAFSWAPDGQELAMDLLFKLYIASSDGSSLEPLLNPEGLVDVIVSLAWAPDNSAIAFTGCREFDCSIFSINPDGSGLTELSVGIRPSWSPDSSKIVFQLDGGMATMNADGSNVVRLLDYGSSPQWAPSGDEIVFSSSGDSNREIYVINPDGSNIRQLTSNSADDFFPVWIP